MSAKQKSAWLWLCALIALLLPAAASAQPGQQHIHPQLVVESAAPGPGKPVTIALVMTADKGWHGYWENPGDAGVPLSIAWRLPGGAAVDAFRYPVPSTLLIAGLMNYVYEGEYALLATLTLPADAKPGERLRIAADAEWLACTDEICVPERGPVALELTVGDGRIVPALQARFDGWRGKLPRPLGGQARFETADGKMRIAVPLPSSVAVKQPVFFPLTQNAVDYAAPQSISRNGDALIIEAKVTGTPGRLSGVLKLDGDTGLWIDAVPGAVPPAGEVIGTVSSWSVAAVAAAIGGAILGGLLLNVMPCVFPILSLKALSLARIGESERGARIEALAYSAGVVLSCLVLGGALLALRASGDTVGWAFQLQVPAIVLSLLLLMVAITLNLAGVFEIGGVGAGQKLASSGGAQGAFWTGVLAAFVATPCTGPFMGAALGAALVVPTAIGLGIFAALGFGLALPFLLIAFVPALRNRLPRPGAWMDRFRRIMAVPMALTALALLWILWRQTGSLGLAIGIGGSVLLSLLLWWIGRQRVVQISPLAALGAVVLGSAAVSAAAAGPLNRAKADGASTSATTAFSETRLARLRAEGKPVFVYFTADWCLTCKVNERVAIGRTEVADAFKLGKIEVLSGDWTNGDPGIGRFLEAHGRSGVPLYLYYRPGKPEPEVLPQVLTPGMLVKLAS